MTARRILAIVLPSLLCTAAHAQWSGGAPNPIYTTMNVGIGTATPSGLLHVTGTSSGGIGINLNPTLTSGYNTGLQVAPTGMGGSVSGQLFGINAQADQWTNQNIPSGLAVGLNAAVRYWDVNSLTQAMGARYGVANSWTGTITNAYVRRSGGSRLGGGRRSALVHSETAENSRAALAE